MAPLVGVLALQGGFAAHAEILRGLGAQTREVRVAADLEGLDGLVLPGGESTTIMLGIAREGLAEPLRQFAAGGMPVLGTCAGMIVLDRDHLGVLDLRTKRNAFGRQIHSFETEIVLDGFAKPLRGVFIRAPWIAESGSEIQLLAEYEGHPVAARRGAILVVAFHPELAGEPALHVWLLEEIRRVRASAAPPGASPAGVRLQPRSVGREATRRR